MTPARRALALAAILATAPGCSPEADRVRGGGPGSDVGNRREEVVLHDARKPFHGTPVRTGTR